MKSRVRVSLYVPTDELKIGGKNPIIGTKEFEFEEIASNAHYLEMLLHGYLAIGYHPTGQEWFCCVKNSDGSFKYDKTANLFTGTAHLATTLTEHIEKLAERGWKIDQEALAYYGLKF